MVDIKKVAVLGSGVMGSGIAAHMANAGIPVVLLDIVKPGEKNRNALTEGGVEKQLGAKPSGFVHKNKAKLVTCGNLEDNLGLLKECDWIVEAVLEKLEVKQEVYRKVDAARKPGSIVSSNTSTLPIHELVKGLPPAFAKDFMITHFFNPPRFMRLLEVVKGEQTRPDAFEAISRFADVTLGKGIVECKDTPGFIANRIGVYWLMLALLEAIRMGVTPEQADAVMGRPVGIPKTGVFGLFDLIGIDLMPLIAREMLHTLPESDSFRTLYTEPELVKKMIADGYTGRKGKGGFYRIHRVECFSCRFFKQCRYGFALFFQFCSKPIGTVLLFVAQTVDQLKWPVFPVIAHAHRFIDAGNTIGNFRHERGGVRQRSR